MGTEMLGLEMQLPPPSPHRHQPPSQNPQNPTHLNQPQMVDFAQQSVKHGYPYTAAAVASEPKQSSPPSDDDDHGFIADDATGDGKRKTSIWQRMKWTDNIVRILLLAVYSIVDEVGYEGNDPTSKKKTGALLQRKGKWKSVSRAMVEKGVYVSPQQCEDKFNDLNKRYKRINDILGKEAACRVVENQSLLDSMDLSPKMKKEVRKLLNSKHLFFKEICAYHDSCGHNSTAAAVAASDTNYLPEGAVEKSHTQHQKHCLHSTDNSQIMTNSSGVGTEISKMGKRVRGEEEEEEDDNERDEDEDEDGGGDDDDDEEETDEGNAISQNGHGHEEVDKHAVKRPRREGPSASIQQLNGEIMSVMQDRGKTPREKSQWLKLRLLHLEEKQMNHQFQAFEIEKQRLKWLEFSSKKERELEIAKLEIERRRLENVRVMLLVREKEIKLL